MALCEAQMLVKEVLQWTTSTVAQTLAGGLALVGAFVLHRLEALGRAMEQVALDFAGDEQIGKVDRSAERGIESDYAQRRFASICARYDGLRDQLEHRARAALDRPRARLGVLLGARNRMLSGVKRLLWLTAPSICFAVVALSGSSLAATLQYLPWVLVVLSAASACLCVASYAVFVWKALVGADSPRDEDRGAGEDNSQATEAANEHHGEDVGQV